MAKMRRAARSSRSAVRKGRMGMKKPGNRIRGMKKKGKTG